MITAPGAAMLDSKLFVGRLRPPFPDLFERWWDGDEWVWVNHGRPGGVDVTGVPGAEMLDEKLFVTVRDGRLFERHWRADLGAWAWEDHGRPADRPIVAGPAAVMMAQKLFVVVTTDGCGSGSGGRISRVGPGKTTGDRRTARLSRRLVRQ